MNNLFVFFVATIACINAGPIQPSAENSEAAVADLKNALEPVQTEFRAMVDNAEYAVKDLSELAVKSAGELSASVKDMLNPTDRANPSNILKNFAGEANKLGRNMMDKAMNDFQPLKMNSKTLSKALNDAVESVQDKYLTPDGKDLVKALARSSNVLKTANNNN